MKTSMPDTDLVRVLLIGASGRVGRMVLHHWRRLPPKVHLTPQYRQPVAHGCLVWDPLTGPEALVGTTERFDAMVVLAGATPGLGRDLSANKTLADACLTAALKAGISRVLLASSSAVYGAGHGAPFSEQVPCLPVNDYGLAKLEMEQACARWRQSGLEVCCLRIGNVAGADALLLNIATSAPEAAIELDAFSDGYGPIRSYIGARTMASVLQSLCLHTSRLPPVLNLAAPAPISMDALADAARHPRILRAAPDHAHQYITLDCSLLSSLHEFDAADSQPEEMIRQWKDTLSA